jgi:hypothetical protein
MDEQIKIRVVIKIFKAEGSYRATLDIIDHGIKDYPFKTIVFTSKSSLFLGCSFDGGLATFNATLNAVATEMSGMWKEGQLSLPVTFKRTSSGAEKSK